jgi:hypothetical protein
MNPTHTHPPHQHALAPYAPSGMPGPHAVQNLDISSGLLVAHEGAGVLMPQVCVACGSSERGGELLNRKLYWSPKWTYATLLISPLLFFLCYYAARKTLQTQYYLCPSCADRSRKVRMGTSVGWVTLLGSVGVAFATGSPEIVVMISFAVFFLMLLLALIGRAPLRITSFQEGRFILQAKAAAYAERIGAPLQLAGPQAPHPPHMQAPYAAPQAAHPPMPQPHYPPHQQAPAQPPYAHAPQGPVAPAQPAPGVNPDGTDGDV